MPLDQSFESMNAAGKMTNRLQARMVARGLIYDSLYARGTPLPDMLCAYDGAFGDAYWRDWSYPASGADLARLLAVHLAGEAVYQKRPSDAVRLPDGRVLTSESCFRLDVARFRQAEILTLIAAHFGPLKRDLSLEKIIPWLCEAGRVDLTPISLSAWWNADRPLRAAKSIAGVGRQPRKRGRRPDAVKRAEADMISDMRCGRITPVDLEGEKQEALASRYGVSRSTATKARQSALLKINGARILDN